MSPKQKKPAAANDDKRFHVGHDRQPTTREKLRAHIGKRRVELQNLKQYQPKKPPKTKA